MLDRRRRWSAALMVAIGLAVLSTVLTACGRLPGQPPLNVEFRDSIVRQGQIVVLTNPTNDRLTEINVKITNPNGDVRRHTVEELRPRDSVELGWRKLDGFQVQRGARVSVRCKGHPIPYLIKLAAGPDRSGALVEDD